MTPTNPPLWSLIVVNKVRYLLVIYVWKIHRESEDYLSTSDDVFLAFKLLFVL